MRPEARDMATPEDLQCHQMHGAPMVGHAGTAAYPDGGHTPQAATAAEGRSGPWPGRCRALGTGAEYAELVALRIAEHLPASPGVDVVGSRGAKCQGLRNGGGDPHRE